MLALFQFADEDIAVLDEGRRAGPLAILLAAVVLEGDGTAGGEAGLAQPGLPRTLAMRCRWAIFPQQDAR